MKEKVKETGGRKGETKQIPQISGLASKQALKTDLKTSTELLKIFAQKANKHDFLSPAI